MRKSIRNILKNFMPLRARSFIRESSRTLPSAEVKKQMVIGIPQNHEEDAAKKLVPRKMINFAVPLAEHCNLKCHGCDHFAPIANEGFADINEFEKDFARLSQLLGGEAVKIGLDGRRTTSASPSERFSPHCQKAFSHNTNSDCFQRLIAVKTKRRFLGRLQGK